MKDMFVNTCIIGGGASGLMCAVALNNKDILIIEKQDRIGKKILVTGNGKCNLTNENFHLSSYNTLKVEPFFKRFGVYKTLNFFDTLGLKTYTDGEGRVYPISNTATSVLDVIRLNIEKNNVKIKCNSFVKKLIKKDKTFQLILQDDTIVNCKNVVLSLGGNCNLDFIENINLPKLNYIASLGALKTQKNKGLNNIKVSNVEVSLKLNENLYTEKGEILFKDNAISGIAIFNISTYLARINNFNATLMINLLPEFDKQSLIKELKKRREIFKDYFVENFFTGFFHKAISINLLEKCNINLHQKISLLTNQNLEELADLILCYKIKTEDILDNNQVYSGGVDLDLLDENLQLKTCENLFLTGEMLNVDAVCGGYNLQWAWTSANVVAKYLNEKE